MPIRISTGKVLQDSKSLL